MKIVIGLRHGGGQLSFELDWKEEDLVSELQKIRESDGLLDFSDVKGDRVLLPADSIGYILVPTETERRVGFGRP